jgi:hypothetical protein
MIFFMMILWLRQINRQCAGIIVQYKARASFGFQTLICSDAGESSDPAVKSPQWSAPLTGQAWSLPGVVALTR